MSEWPRERIDAEIKRQNLSLGAAAERMGIPRKTLWDWRTNGVRTPWALRVLENFAACGDSSEFCSRHWHCQQWRAAQMEATPEVRELLLGYPRLLRLLTVR